ncbi:MAG: hypothetical protein M3314_00575, partial [Actinomycetota bacterium]|nr:hypothetical protein [Actinomycetota bacterium]
ALAVVLFTLFHPGIRQPQGIDDLDADAAVWPRAAPRAPLAHAEELPPVPQATSGNGANGRAPVRRRNPAP